MRSTPVVGMKWVIVSQSLFLSFSTRKETMANPFWKPYQEKIQVLVQILWIKADLKVQNIKRKISLEQLKLSFAILCASNEGEAILYRKAQGEKKNSFPLHFFSTITLLSNTQLHQISRGVNLWYARSCQTSTFSTPKVY